MERCQKAIVSDFQAIESCDICTPVSNYKFPSFLSFLVLILPKCPFCFVAYTSAMTMCGSSTLVSQHIDWAAYLSIVLSATVIYCIARNNRGQGTRKAIIISSFGLLFVVAGIFLTENIISYYFGSILLLLAAYYNGSGFKIINKIFNHLLFRFTN